MFAYCANNPIRYADLSGQCYYDANGNWCHDAWENLGGYQKKDPPELLYVAKNENSTVFFVQNSAGAISVPPNVYVVYDNREQNGGSNNNFEIYNSYRINGKWAKLEIINSIIEYNSLTNNYGWNRDKYSMLNEWYWHNGLYSAGFRPSSTKSVNFDMGTFANALNPLWQIAGYGYDHYLRPHIQPNLGRIIPLNYLYPIINLH